MLIEQRTLKYIKKIIRNNVKSLQPSKIIGRFSGPKVLINSIPKAGTHLLESALENFPTLRNINIKTIRLDSWDFVIDSDVNKLKRIKKGSIHNSHLPYFSELENEIKKQGIKHILIIRNPQDILGSHLKYILQIHKSHPNHKYFISLKDDNERLMSLLTGVKGIVVGMKEILTLYLPWLESSNTLVVKFEDLIGVQGGGSDISQANVLKEIITYLSLPLDDSEFNAAMKKIFNHDSITYNKNKKSNYNEIFSDEHLEYYSKNIKPLAKELGY